MELRFAKHRSALAGDGPSFLKEGTTMGPTNPTSSHADHDHNHGPQARATSRLHKRVYTLLMAFSAWFALAVWIFAGRGVTDYLLFIVSGFIFVVVTLQLILSRVGRTAEGGKDCDDWASFREWATSDFETWQDRLSGAQAAVHILLPIAVAAFGMTAFGIIFHITERGAN
jgi:hypothetical protein